MEQDMRYIYRVYQEGSFSKAAEKLFLTQPALSIAIKRVEDSIGAALFDRSRHPLELTEAGRASIRAIEQMSDLEDDLEREISDLRDLKTGKLLVGGSHYLNSYILARILSGFSRRYPGVRIALTEKGSDELIADLEERKLDLPFSCDPELVERFEHRLAFQDMILLAVPKKFLTGTEPEKAALTAAQVMEGKHLRPDCPKVALSCFREMEFILLGAGNNLHSRNLQMFDQAGFTPKIKMTLSQLVTAYRLADNEMGITFIADRMVRSPVSNLMFFRIDSELTERSFHILLPKRNYTAHAVRAFADYAVSELKNEADRFLKQ